MCGSRKYLYLSQELKLSHPPLIFFFLFTSFYSILADETPCPIGISHDLLRVGIWTLSGTVILARCRYAFRVPGESDFTC